MTILSYIATNTLFAIAFLVGGDCIENADPGSFGDAFFFLIRDRTPIFSLSWTVMHPVDENSPLWGATSESLAETRSMLIVSLSGIDETVCSSLHAPYSYAASDILWGHRFADIIDRTPEGHQYIDFTHFHETVLVTETQSEQAV